MHAGLQVVSHEARARTNIPMVFAHSRTPRGGPWGLKAWLDFSSCGEKIN